MGAFVYRCPNTGFRVQGWVEDDESEDSVVCHACGRLHLVNPKTGETASSNVK
jgi:DNA-directed RNA polymerase subunit RPC12/RpoP